MAVAVQQRPGALAQSSALNADVALTSSDDHDPVDSDYGTKTVEIEGCTDWPMVDGEYHEMKQGKNNGPCYYQKEHQLYLVRSADGPIWQVSKKANSPVGLICVEDNAPYPWRATKPWAVVTGSEGSLKMQPMPKIKVTLHRDVVILSGRAGFNSRINGLFEEMDEDYAGFPAYIDAENHKYLRKDRDNNWIVTNRFTRPLRNRPKVVFGINDDKSASRPWLCDEEHPWFVCGWAGAQGTDDVDILCKLKDANEMKEPPQFMIIKSRQHPQCNGGYTIELGNYMNELPVFMHKPEKGRNTNQKYLYFDGLCWCISSSIDIGRADADCTSTRRPQLRMPDSSAWPEAQVRGVKNQKTYTEWKDSRVALFTDPDFPPCAASLGETEGIDPNDVVWSRAQDCMDGHLCLFDTISPADICQGALGDCWLMASCAALAEFPPRVEDLFVTKKINAQGRYEIRLWDVNTQDWQIVPVSDMIPCHERNPWESHPMPLFAQCDHAELWTMLLEKAFAKLAGNFSNLKGGRPELALQALTGCKEMWCFQHLGDATWQKMFIDAPKGTPRDFKNIQGEKAKDPPEPSAKFFEMLKTFDHSNFLMITLIESDGEKKRGDGLVAGHAYSLITAETVKGHNFVKLRNPWGNDVEWNGKWADGDKTSWLANPEICLKLQGRDFQEHLMDKDGPAGVGDGIFWMEFEEFQQNYTQITVCPKDMGEIHSE